MIRKATPADLVAIVPSPGEAKDWLTLVSADNLPEIIEKNNIHVVEHGGKPVFAFGVGRLKLCAAEIPWIWGVADDTGRRDYRRAIRENAAEAMAILAKIAPGGYTSPETSDPKFARFLNFLGFRSLEWGLWQCPSSAKRS